MSVGGGNCSGLDISKFAHRDIIDVGGYIGDSALVFSEFTDKNVYVFEPVSKNFKKVLKTIELNDKKNIVPVNTALGAKRDTVVMNSAGISSCCQTVLNNIKGIKGVETVNVMTLDEYVEQNNINAGLIKVDIEGYEQEFLKGALNTIKSHRPVMILSIYHNASDFFDIKPMIEELNLGYKFKIFKPYDGTILTETVLICDPE